MHTIPMILLGVRKGSARVRQDGTALIPLLKRTKNLRPMRKKIQSERRKEEGGVGEKKALQTSAITENIHLAI